MRLDADEARRRLVAADHGILATVHPDRGVDAVPVCFVVDGATLVVPIDQVKPKATTELRRTANLDLDPRATLLVERWDPADWSQLWWVRAELRRVPVDGDARPGLEDALRDKYRQYRSAPFADLLAFQVLAVSGWSAAAGEPPP